MSTSKVEFDLSFSSETKSDTYKLLELPPELCKIIEEGVESEFTIRGRSTDDAVLCTASRTYALRSVALSNTILLTTPAAGDPDEPGTTEKLIVRDEICQLIELVHTAPRLQRLEAMLKGCEYDEGHERDDEEESDFEDEMSEEKPIKRARITRKQVESEVQASDAELALGFKQFCVLEINGYLRPLSPAYLTQILETLLNSIVSQGFPLPPQPVNMSSLIQHLDVEHEYPPDVIRQFLPWFGLVSKNEWVMDSHAVVREIGLGRLRFHKQDDPASLNDFIEAWKTAVGDSFSALVDLKLLEGNYLVTPAPPSTPLQISYFPISGLPDVASQLFSDLFLTRSRWLGDDIKPFLSTIAVDHKEKERLLMKFARATIDTSGKVWYTARAGQL